MNARAIVLTGVGFLVGVGEALVYYNMGKSAGSGFQFRIPPGRELAKTAGMVLLTSVVTTLLFRGVEIMMEPSAASNKRQLATTTAEGEPNEKKA